MKEFGITKAMIEAKGAELYKNQTIVDNKGHIVDQEKFNDALFALMEDRFKGGMEIQAKSYKGLMSTISGVWKTGLAQMAGISGTGEIIEGSAFDSAKKGLNWIANKMQDMSKAGAFESIGKKIGSTVQTGIKYGKKVIDVAKKIKDSVADTIKTISAKLEPLRPTFDSIKDKAVSLGRKLTDGFTRAGPSIKTFAETYIPKAVEAVAKLADKAMSFANFIIDNWSFISPILKGVVAGFLAFKAMKGFNNIVGKVKQFADIFQTIKGISGFAGKIKGLASAFKGFKGIATLLTSPIGQIALVIGIFTAGCILVIKNFDKIKAAVSKFLNWAGEGLRAFGDFLGGTFGTLISGIAGGFQLAWTDLKNLGSSIWSGIQTLGSNIGSFFSGVWDGIVSGFKGFINIFINGINTIIGGFNKLSFTAPDWVPGIGGKTIGFNLPTIPLLAKGGIATGPTLAMVGEGREHEAILPLSKLQNLIDRAKGNGGGGGTVYHYNPHIEVNGGKPEDVERIMAEDKKRFEKWRKEQEEYERRTRIKPKPKLA